MANNCGNLDILVLQATGLKDVESFGSQDPYVKVELSGQQFQTKTKTDGGKNPVWNARFTAVNVSPSYSTELTVTVLDRNVMMSDTVIGSARVPLARVYAARGAEDMRIPLVSKKGKSAGELQLLLTFKPHVAAAAATPQPAAPAVHTAPAAQPTVVYAAVPAPPVYAAGPAPAPIYGAPPAPVYGMQPGYPYAAPPAAYPPGPAYPPAANYPATNF